MSISSHRSLGIIADRFEVLIATAPQPLSVYQREKGIKAETGVWLMVLANNSCAWQSTVERVAERVRTKGAETVGEAIFGDAELSRQLATMIAEAAK